jgi:hypothetical protein
MCSAHCPWPTSPVLWSDLSRTVDEPGFCPTCHDANLVSARPKSWSETIHCTRAILDYARPDGDMDMAFAEHMRLTIDRDERGSDRMEALTVPSPHGIWPDLPLLFDLRRMPWMSSYEKSDVSLSKGRLSSSATDAFPSPCRPTKSSPISVGVEPTTVTGRDSITCFVPRSENTIRMFHGSSRYHHPNSSGT